AERRLTEIVAERDRLDEVLVQEESAADRARDLGHLERVRQAVPAVVLVGREEPGLRLLAQAAERAAVDDTVAVALEIRPVVERAPLVLDGEPARRAGGPQRPRGEPLVLGPLEPEAHRFRHGPPGDAAHATTNKGTATLASARQRRAIADAKVAVPLAALTRGRAASSLVGRWIPTRTPRRSSTPAPFPSSDRSSGT